MDPQAPKGSFRKKPQVFVPGSIIGAQYTVVECLGVGATSTVYRVQHKNFGEQDLVLKVLHPEVSSDETAAARFQVELLASYEVNHPNVIRSYEFIREEGMLAYTMEYAAGGDLRKLMAQYQQLPIDMVINILDHISAGLYAIHQAGIVHRDLKPENIFFTKDGIAKIADFGIARLQSGRNLTKHGEVIGAIDFCSPEYIESGNVDARSDIYAVGLIAYELLTRRPAFIGRSPMETLMQRMTGDPVPPNQVRSDCPAALSEIVLKAARRNPQERFQNANQISEAIQAMRDGVPLESSQDSLDTLPIVAPDFAAESEEIEEEQEFFETEPHPHHNGHISPPIRRPTRSAWDSAADEPVHVRRNFHLPVAIASVVFLVGLIGWLFSGGRNEPDAGTPEQIATTDERPVGGTEPLEPGEKVHSYQDVVKPPHSETTKVAAEPKTALVTEREQSSKQVASKNADEGNAKQSPVQSKTVAPVGKPLEPAVVSATLSVRREAQAAEAVAPTVPVEKTGESEKSIVNPGLPQSVSVSPASLPEPENDMRDQALTHRVEEGDTPSKIAAKYAVSLDELMKLNGFNNVRRIPIGFTVLLPQRSKKVTEVEPQPTVQADVQPVLPAPSDSIIQP